MIIVSQPRNSITNFDNITDIKLEEYENKSWIIKCYIIDDKYINLAIYKTEKRAKEILKEIARFYRMSEAIKYVNSEVQVGILKEIDKEDKVAFVYEMPEE